MKKGDPVEEFDDKKIAVRLPNSALLKAYQWRLNEADCMNKGYVLDGFPKFSKQAEGIFSGDSGANIIPQSVILLEGSDDFLRSKVK